MSLEGAGGIVRHGIALEHCRNAGIDGHRERIDGAIGIGDRVEAGALGSGGNGHDLCGSQHLAKALVLGEVEGTLAAIVGMGNEDRTAVSEAKLIAAEGRNAARIGRGCIVEVVARIKSRVAHKLEDRSVKTAGRPGSLKWPSAPVIASALTDFAVRRIFAAGMGAPAGLCRTPCQTGRAGRCGHTAAAKSRNAAIARPRSLVALLSGLEPRCRGTNI